MKSLTEEFVGHQALRGSKLAEKIPGIKQTQLTRLKTRHKRLISDEKLGILKAHKILEFFYIDYRQKITKKGDSWYLALLILAGSIPIVSHFIFGKDLQYLVNSIVYCIPCVYVDLIFKRRILATIAENFLLSINIGIVASLIQNPIAKILLSMLLGVVFVVRIKQNAILISLSRFWEVGEQDEKG